MVHESDETWRTADKSSTPVRHDHAAMFGCTGLPPSDLGLRITWDASTRRPISLIPPLKYASRTRPLVPLVFLRTTHRHSRQAGSRP